MMNKMLLFLNKDLIIWFISRLINMYMLFKYNNMVLKVASYTFLNVV